MINAIFDISLELAPWLLLGAVVAGLLHVLVPVDFFQRHLSGRWGVFKAVVIGIPMPLCSCGVIPVGVGLKKKGASDGAIVGFLISTPQTGVDSIFVTASMLGLPFAMFKVAAALVTGVVGGWLVDVTESAGEESEDTSDSHRAHARGRLGEFAEHSLMLVRSIWVWIVLGVVASAAITTFLPDDWLAGFSSLGGLPAMLVTLLISLPIYVCATASVPIAAALVASGLPPGAAIVFLMAGPASNVATMGAIFKTIGGRALAIYLVTVIGGSVIAGLLFNFLVDPIATELMTHHHDPSWWRLGSVILLGLMMLWFAVDDCRAWVARRKISQLDPEVSTTLPVSGMTCNGCAQRLENALRKQTGVRNVSVSYPDGQAIVDGDVERSELVRVVREAGFDVPSDEASSDNKTLPVLS